MPPEAAVAADEEDRDGLPRSIAFVFGPSLASDWRRSAWAGTLVERLGQRVGELDVEAPDRVDDVAVVALDREAERDEEAGDDEREPAALGELLEARDDEDRHAQRQADEVDRQVPVPVGVLLAVLDPERLMPRLESENVRNTLIEYMTTSFSTSPCV